mmetsp:Transcript_59066/g.104991  ORF Transcript_59066/g.104991 Transcript_59066/m.104991 type:complete len:169 (+) Transcript_59066:18-524(+)
MKLPALVQFREDIISLSARANVPRPPVAASRLGVQGNLLTTFPLLAESNSSGTATLALQWVLRGLHRKSQHDHDSQFLRLGSRSLAQTSGTPSGQHALPSEECVEQSGLSFSSESWRCLHVGQAYSLTNDQHLHCQQILHEELLNLGKPAVAPVGPMTEDLPKSTFEV